MIRNSNHEQYLPEDSQSNGSASPIDYTWFQSQFGILIGRIEELENVVVAMDQRSTATSSTQDNPMEREYYSVPEFANLVERNHYTVREWCRLDRINAEKCESGRGEAKNWKIPVDELQRYKDHGLLPLRYPR